MRVLRRPMTRGRPIRAPRRDHPTQASVVGSALAVNDTDCDNPPQVPRRQLSQYVPALFEDVRARGVVF